MTRSTGKDAITYFTLQQAGLDQTGLCEVQLSHFDPVAHSYLPLRLDRRPDEVLPGLRFVGPVALFHAEGQTLLAAYEHGADHPQSFFEFEVAPPGRTVTLRALKGNTYHGELFTAGRPWESVWFELGLFPGELEGFLPEYRRFFLDEVSLNRQSRQPYIYYNTWNYQERQRYFKGRPYLESMNAERMLAEIDVAYRLGVDVFVIDTGWYVRTGDWLVDRRRFPEGLREVKRRLDGYGMKLGLWFNPTVAALTSRIYSEHPEYEMTWDGKPAWRGPVWETEESTGMCLASDYAGDYIETMVRLNHELGVTYFKWDGVSQYGCNSPLHHHGTLANPPEERAECYAYQMGKAMIQIVEQVTQRCPDVIVDFDVTEGGRFVGLGFLSAGKYFLVNNGPYFSDLDIPRSVKIEPDPINVFFYPGPARPRICRTGARFDDLIPSILFLTHYLPDGPQLSQRNNLAALMLGGNGLWGDLPALSEEEIAFISEQMTLYKQVRQAVTRAYPRRIGFAGSSPEIHEKLDPATASGLVAFFTVTPGAITHITQPLDPAKLGQVVGADAWEWVEGGRVKLIVTLERNDARVVYFIKTC
jgi:alpha-galactosidase